MPRGEVVGRKRGLTRRQAVEIENDQRRHLVAVDAGNHHVPNQRRAGRDQPARSGPTLTQVRWRA
jgi:hypothetical protein